MKRLLFVPLAILTLVAAACNNSGATPSPSSSLAIGGYGSSSPSAASSASARASGSAAANASASAGTSSKYIDLKVVTPADSDKAGIDGKGWIVDLVATGKGAALDQVQPKMEFLGSPGANPAFPGLVVTVKVTSGGGQTSSNGFKPDQNLATLFQMVGLPNTNGVSLSSARSSSAPAASASAAGASASPSSVAVATTGGATTGGSRGSSNSGDNLTAEATWFVQNAYFGTDVDVEMTVYVVEGTAPDTISDSSSTNVVSNKVTVKFHINGNGQASTTGGSSSSSPAASPSGSPAASPSSSPSSSP